MEVDKKQLDFVRHLFSKKRLLKWVWKYSADRISKNIDVIKQQLDLDNSDNSIIVPDNDKVKAIITDVEYSGKTHSSYDLLQLKEIISALGGKQEGTLIVSDKPNVPLMIQLGEDMVILAPKIDTDEVKKEAEKEKEKDKKKDKKEKEQPKDEYENEELGDNE